MRDYLEGPEQPTLFERFATRRYLPYSAVCLILAIAPGYGGSNFGQSSLSWLLWTLLAFYMFYIVRYMRLRVLKTEMEIIPLCPEGEETFHKAFGRLSRPLGQILAMLVIGMISILYFWRLFSFGDFFHLAFAAGTIFLFSVAWGSVFWVYLSSLTGVHDLGRNPLRLKSCYDDGMLGVRPLGSLSLQLTIVYLSVVSLGALATAFFADPVSIMLLSSFTVIGVALFFLPLTSIHRLMLQEKGREHALIRRELSKLVRKPKHQVSNSLNTTLADLEDLLMDFRDLLAFDLSERKVMSVPAWPFDSSILSQLALVTFSVTTTIIAQVIIVELHL